MITISDRKESHRLYQELQRERPDLFKSSPSVKYVTNQSEIEKYEQETGERVGVLYKMHDYEVFIVDLIAKNGKLSLHGRIVLPFNGIQLLV